MVCIRGAQCTARHNHARFPCKGKITLDRADYREIEDRAHHQAIDALFRQQHRSRPDYVTPGRHVNTNTQIKV
ncbi:MAG: hypothetical protein GVY29_11180 [Spirochaetes bacterium]|nr:hypothetical protein [Spirochaetota bacterium]